MSTGARKRSAATLRQRKQYGNVEWQTIKPDKRHTWLTEGLHIEFETYIPLGSREAKATKGETADVLFQVFSNGVKTNRDAWVYNFNCPALVKNMGAMIDTYNEQGIQVGKAKKSRRKR